MSFSIVSMRNVFIAMLISLAVTHYVSAEIHPSSSAVLIPAGKEETTIDIKNSGDESVLLYSKINLLPDDDLAKGTIITDPQTVLMAPGETQSIRVIYQTNTPDNKEHIARVIFSGLPPTGDVSDGKVKILIGHDLPVVINVRKDMAQKDIWERIRYSITDSGLCLLNPTAKVFRFSPTIVADESKIEITFKKAYILPGEALCALPNRALSKGMHINLTSVSDYNYRIKTNKVVL
ncbi:fimbria/pilus periplasmic chaperone [Lonsdalea quercina]|uniref:fimbria/pilus periplasmic chaperone n=1 Tax=Lonsdalea quercina TaxID=71657 RepID=UPI00397578D4